MKKLIVLVVALAMILSLAVVAYGAVDVANERQFGYTNRANRQFIDEDGDGICDNGGICARDGSGAQFIDEDGDGICDNSLNGGVPLRNGTGRQNGRQGK